MDFTKQATKIQFQVTKFCVPECKSMLEKKKLPFILLLCALPYSRNKSLTEYEKGKRIFICLEKSLFLKLFGIVYRKYNVNEFEWNDGKGL